MSAPPSTEPSRGGIMIEENGGGERTVGDNRARGGRKSGRNWGRGRGARGSSGIENGARPGTQPFTMNQRKPGSVPSDRVSPSLGRGQVPELGKPQSEASGDIEAEVCFICASPVQHTAVSPCNHRTCHICALRLRALYKTRACAHCRTEAQYVIFTDDATKRYEDFTDADFARIDQNIGVKYENTEIYEDTVLLLRYICPEESCDVACLGWPDLHRHVRSVHQKVMCDLCARNKKVFTHEHELFTPSELRKHEKFGDDHPGAVDQTGFKGHPECGFCRQRFYGDDELYAHCRDKHERCHICDRRNPGRRPQYYVNYDSLEAHFRKDHFLCSEKECLEKKFVVFDSEIDLKAHQLEVHPSGLSKDARRDARRIDMSGFDYRAPHQLEGRGGREGRGRGRGRDPNTEPIPQSTAQPLRRDELAYQRQMAIQSAQNIAPRSFGGRLTSEDVHQARDEIRASERENNRSTTTTTTPPPRPLPQNVSPPGTILPPTHAPTPEEQARQLRHASVTERATRMSQNDSSTLDEFRAKISSYKTSQISASGLIESFSSLFNTTANDLGILIKELAEIFENESKRRNLLKAWNDWRAINEDYPALPEGIPSTTSSASWGGGTRVLRLKSSTAQSSRSTTNRNSSWGTAGAASPLPSATSASAQRTGAGGQVTTPWIKPNSNRPSPATSRPASRPPNERAPEKATEAFPALPVAAKPGINFGYGLGPRGAANGTPWSISATNSQSASAAGSESESWPRDDAADKRKGKKSKKQVLYHFG